MAPDGATQALQGGRGFQDDVPLTPQDEHLSGLDLRGEDQESHGYSPDRVPVRFGSRLHHRNHVGSDRPDPRSFTAK